MDATVIVALVGVAGAVVTATVTGFVTWLVSKRPADATVQTAINAGFQVLAQQYQTQNAELKAQLDEALFRLDQQTSEIRDLVQHVESLENVLRRHGLDIPRRTLPHRLAQPPLASVPNG